MSKRKYDDGSDVVIEPIVETVAAPVEAAPAAPVAGYVVIVNLENSPRDITLYDGTNVRLAPFSKVGTDHKSAPILKRLIPDAVKKLVTRRWVKIEEAK